MINTDERLLKLIDEAEYWLLSHITKYVNRNSLKGYPSNSRILEDTGWGIEKLQRVKQSLVKKGLLLIDTRYSKKRQTSNLYTLNTEYLGLYIPGKNNSGIKGDEKDIPQKGGDGKADMGTPVDQASRTPLPDQQQNRLSSSSNELSNLPKAEKKLVGDVIHLTETEIPSQDPNPTLPQVESANPNINPATGRLYPSTIKNETIRATWRKWYPNMPGKDIPDPGSWTANWFETEVADGIKITQAQYHVLADWWQWPVDNLQNAQTFSELRQRLQGAITAKLKQQKAL